MEVRTLNNIRNSEGYMDTTPYHAMKKDLNHYVRGEVFRAGRNNSLFVIISGASRETEAVQSIIELRNDNNHKGCCVPVTTKHGMFYANPNAVTYILEKYIYDYVCSVKPEEMAVLDKAIAKSIGLQTNANEIKIIEKPVEKIVEKIVEKPAERAYPAELYDIKAEARIYKGMYEELLKKVIANEK